MPSGNPDTESSYKFVYTGMRTNQLHSIACKLLNKLKNFSTHFWLIGFSFVWHRLIWRKGGKMQFSPRLFNTLVFFRILSIWYKKYLIQQPKLYCFTISKISMKKYTHNSLLKLDYLFLKLSVSPYNTFSNSQICDWNCTLHQPSFRLRNLLVNNNNFHNLSTWFLNENSTKFCQWNGSMYV